MMSADTASVPGGVDELTPRWLTDALGTTVTDVRVERIAQDTGFSSLLYRLHLTAGAEVPATLNDQALVRHYLDHLAGHGVTDYSFDDAWRHYRFAAVYLTLTDRAVAAIDEIGAPEEFG